MESMYEKLMELPLFQGVSRDKLSELIEKTPFHFVKYNKGQQIVSANDNCTHIRFIISGDVRIDISSTNRRVAVSETLSGPDVIGADYLFGRNTFYPFNATALTECGILQIVKADFINILMSDKVFLFNMLNMLSRNSQKSTFGIMALSSGSIAERLAFIVTSLTQKGSKDIKIVYKQKDLCSILGVQRSSLIHALEKMNIDGVIDYTMTEIKVNSREALLEILHSED
ncbi:MAG: Crp/Fnr family transcriptional regulator [Muribaculaceae bacterium]|nr:Crp/Fnr family transcriptional regulator [Muribaculaceae bacterium]